MPAGSKLVIDRREGRLRWRVRMPDGPLVPYPEDPVSPKRCLPSDVSHRPDIDELSWAADVGGDTRGSGVF